MSQASRRVGTLLLFVCFLMQLGTFAFSADTPQTIVVKFKDGEDIRSVAGELRGRGIDDRRELRRFLQQLRGEWRSAIGEDRSHALEQLRQRGMERTGKPLPDMRLYFEWEVPKNLNAERLVQLLEASPAVEWAAIKPELRPIQPFALPEERIY